MCATWIEAAASKGTIDNIDCTFIIFNDIRNVLTTFKPYVLYICTVVLLILVKKQSYYRPQTLSTGNCFLKIGICSPWRWYTSTEHIGDVTLRGGADKSLARPGRNKLQRPNSGFIQHTPHEHSLARCYNFCKPLKKTLRKVLYLQPGLCGSNDLRVRRKMANFQFFFQSR